MLRVVLQCNLADSITLYHLYMVKGHVLGRANQIFDIPPSPQGYRAQQLWARQNNASVYLMCKSCVELNRSFLCTAHYFRTEAWHLSYVPCVPCRHCTLCLTLNARHRPRLLAAPFFSPLRVPVGCVSITPPSGLLILAYDYHDDNRWCCSWTTMGRCRLLWTSRIRHL